jgi:hypothetical protein
MCYRTDVQLSHMVGTRKFVAISVQQSFMVVPHPVHPLTGSLRLWAHQTNMMQINNGNCEELWGEC